MLLWNCKETSWIAMATDNDCLSVSNIVMACHPQRAKSQQVCKTFRLDLPIKNGAHSNFKIAAPKYNHRLTIDCIHRTEVTPEVNCYWTQDQL